MLGGRNRGNATSLFIVVRALTKDYIIRSPRSEKRRREPSAVSSLNSPFSRPSETFSRQTSSRLDQHIDMRSFLRPAALVGRVASRRGSVGRRGPRTSSPSPFIRHTEIVALRRQLAAGRSQASSASSQGEAGLGVQRVLVFSPLWPEPTSSAAGVRTIGLVDAFLSWGWQVAYLRCRPFFSSGRPLLYHITLSPIYLLIQALVHPSIIQTPHANRLSKGTPACGC